jgi:hypothetical protein
MPRGAFAGSRQRKTGMNDTICYCFNYTEADIRRDLAEHGTSTILEKILVAKKMGGCRCETLNPKGR